MSRSSEEFLENSQIDNFYSTFLLRSPPPLVDSLRLSAVVSEYSEYLACSISIWKPWSFRKKIAAHMR